MKEKTYNLARLDRQKLLVAARKASDDGIGEDYIHLNECMAEGKTLLDFPTLYDYD